MTTDLKALAERVAKGERFTINAKDFETMAHAYIASEAEVAWLKLQIEGYKKSELAIAHLTRLMAVVKAVPNTDFGESVCQNLDHAFAEGNQQAYSFWCGMSMCLEELVERGLIDKALASPGEKGREG